MTLLIHLFIILTHQTEEYNGFSAYFVKAMVLLKNKTQHKGVDRLIDPAVKRLL